MIRTGLDIAVARRTAGLTQAERIERALQLAGPGDPPDTA